MEVLNSEGITFKKPLNSVSKNGSGLNGKRKVDSSRVSRVNNDMNLDILRTFEEPSQSIPRRIKLYEKNLEAISNYLEHQQERCHKSLSGKLDDFIRSSFKLVEKESNVMPIGILESGLSIGENSTIFDFIQQRLEPLMKSLNQKIYFVRVQSGTSTSTKAVFQNICRQIINHEHGHADDENHPENNSIKKDNHFSLYDVKSYLDAEELKYKIIILLEGVDYFSNTIISQLLTLLSCANLPVVFIFGATHGHLIDNCIPVNGSATFAVETFYSVSPKSRFEDFMKRVLFESENIFRISGPIAAYLERQYTEDNFSIECIYNAVKFCLRSHFRTAASVFCSFDKSDSYMEADLEMFKQLYLEAESNMKSPHKRRKTTTNSYSTTENALDSSIDEIKNWCFFLRLIRFINSRIPERPLGDTFTQVYISCYEGYDPAREGDVEYTFHKFFRTFDTFSKSDLLDLLEECVSLLTDGPPNIVQKVVPELEKFIGELAKKEDQKVAGSPEDAIPKSLQKIKKKGGSLKELQESLLEHKRKRDGTSVIHTVRTEFVGVLKKLLQSFFPPLHSLKLSNAFVFSDLPQLINTMFPANFLQLDEDIKDPGYVLRCTCCSYLESASVDPKLPDVSIIHKLIAEHTTKKVDLNSIYHAFISVVNPAETRKRKAEDTAASSYLVRFRRAVGELQHMGFVKRSKSQPDEISRLTWW